MIGRLAVRQPWVFAEARNLGNPAFRFLQPIDLEDLSFRFLDLLARHQPPEFHLTRAKRFFGYFCDNVIWGTHLKTLLGRETTLSGCARVLGAYFREHPEERFKKRPPGKEPEGMPPVLSDSPGDLL
jgi:tRNA-dihydrouridine synthase